MSDAGRAELLQRLGYRFRNPSLLRLALTHKSYANEHSVNGALAGGRGDGRLHNERLEFLGDAVLEFVISDAMMDTFPYLSEGQLSKLRAALVSEASLAGIARDLKLGSHLMMGKGERKSGGAEKDSILSDALEALFAAIYQDSREQEGIAEAARVIRHIFREPMASIGNAAPVTDYKSQLQELVQERYKQNVVYQLVEQRGPDHRKEFLIAVSFADQELGRGRGSSKKQAEQAAAQKALLGLEPR